MPFLELQFTIEGGFYKWGWFFYICGWFLQNEFFFTFEVVTTLHYRKEKFQMNLNFAFLLTANPLNYINLILFWVLAAYQSVLHYTFLNYCHNILDTWRALVLKKAIWIGRNLKCPSFYFRHCNAGKCMISSSYGIHLKWVHRTSSHSHVKPTDRTTEINLNQFKLFIYWKRFIHFSSTLILAHYSIPASG